MDSSFDDYETALRTSEITSAVFVSILYLYWRLIFET